MAAVLSELAPGTRFAGHVVGEVIGRGGMGVVYRARHVDLKREVALKVIAPASAGDPGFRVRFRRECTAAAAIEHPNVVPIYHAGEEDGRLYVTMRYVRGTDLAQRIEAAGSLPAEEAVSLVADVAGALDVAHRRGLVHRDVKPGNLLIEEREGAGRALLTDFGLTKDVSATTQLTEAGTVLGTVDYAAPEQLDGDAGVDARTDVYALGCVLYHALTGVVPYPRRTTPAKIFAHLSAPVPAATGVPEPLAAAVARAMAKDPATRYASAGAFARAIQAAVEHAAPVGARGTRAARTMPLAAALSAEHGPFVGRGDALARLERCYELARAGRRQFALVAGEPGIGQTRLGRGFARPPYPDPA